MNEGPLTGLRVVELAGYGPAPLTCMILSDLGADVVRVDRTMPRPALPKAERDVLNRGRRSVAVNLKDARGSHAVRFLAERADVLIEPYRPGVAERLGIGPDICCAANPRLVYARMTGWGQTGPRAARAGHDINYAAVAGGSEAGAGR